MIETRKTEIRYVTSDPKKMLNMYYQLRDYQQKSF